MADVVGFPGLTTAEMPSDKVLSAAIGQIESAVVVGIDSTGALYVAAADGDSDRAIGLLLRAATWLANQADGS
jgi:hypothetical protein